MSWNIITISFAGVFLLNHGFEALLDVLQLRYLSGRADVLPSHLKGRVELSTIRKSVSYNRDKLRLGLVTRVLSAAGTWLMIGFGFSWLDEQCRSLGVGEILTGLVFFAALSLISNLLDLPVELFSVFGVEAKHGFNKQKPKGFFLDKLKGLLIGGILGGLLLFVVLWAMSSLGTWWWLVAFVVVLIIQLLVTWLYPVIIMPMFNEFTPVESALADDIADVAQRVGFPLGSVQTMDGSKRSAHSNAFILGLKGARKIVLYDTLVEKLERSQLVAVLAHELGHFKLGHLRKRLLFVVAAMLAMFAGLGWMNGQAEFYEGLGFDRVSSYAGLVVFVLIVGEMLSPAGWFMRYRSRKDEADADRFAVDTMGGGGQMIEALIRLSEQNLASPGSHKLYRSYHNSHPSLRQRMKQIHHYSRERGYPIDTGGEDEDVSSD